MLLKPIRTSIADFLGPTGCGKTTIAKIIAEQLSLPFKMVSAINTTSADARKILGEAEYRFENRDERSLLLCHEITASIKISKTFTCTRSRAVP